MNDAAKMSGDEIGTGLVRYDTMINAIAEAPVGCSIGVRRTSQKPQAWGCRQSMTLRKIAGLSAAEVAGIMFDVGNGGVKLRKGTRK